MMPSFRNDRYESFSTEPADPARRLMTALLQKHTERDGDWNGSALPKLLALRFARRANQLITFIGRQAPSPRKLRARKNRFREAFQRDFAFRRSARRFCFCFS
jgi:hypothetical protein